MNRARAAGRTHDRVRARAIVPGARVLVTRRCHDRRFFLSPFGDPRKGHTAEQTTNFYGYTLARAALKYGTQIHAACQMGDHHHLSITDELGNRPNFKNSMHGNLARTSFSADPATTRPKGVLARTVSPSVPATTWDLAATAKTGCTEGLAPTRFRAATVVTYSGADPEMTFSMGTMARTPWRVASATTYLSGVRERTFSMEALA